MKTRVLLSSILVVMTMAAVAGAAEHAMRTESGWFDMANCEFCKNLIEDPGLLPHMTWENHKIANGMIQITTVQPEFAKSYQKCSMAMQTLGGDMMSGKRNPAEVKMCGSCAAFGQMMMAGVKMENVEGQAADVALITSEDPAMVAKIHEYCDRNNKEMALLMGESHGEHPGHAEHPEHPKKHGD